MWADGSDANCRLVGHGPEWAVESKGKKCPINQMVSFHLHIALRVYAPTAY